MYISKPLLPPKAGYVEVEVGGVRQYMNVETGETTLNPAPPPTIESLTKELTESSTKLAALDGAMTDLMTTVLPSLVATT